MCPGPLDPGAAGTTEAGLTCVVVLATESVTDAISELVLARPDGFLSRAGQRISVCHGGVCREYSLASGETDDRLRLLVRRFDHGVLSPTLCGLAVGDSIHIGRPKGYFRYRSDENPAVFVATGTGIAPFAAMVRSGVTGFTLLHGVSRTGALYAASEMAATATVYVPCVSRGGGHGSGFSGRVTDYLARHLAPGAYDFYLCGNQLMIRDAAMVVDDRFPGSRIFTEAFY